ncbi:MAG: hypothetical protein ABR536_00900 [Solirubrobacterales bacterium]
MPEVGRRQANRRIRPEEPPVVGKTAAESGSATIEHLALAALIALVVVAAVSALASQPRNRAGRELAAAIGRKLVCAPRAPGPCERNPLARAYGFPLGKLVRALAPIPQPLAAADGTTLVPVDFRRCRRASCAHPRDARLTTSGRLITAFTEVEDLRRSRGPVRITYWLYRPGRPWERTVRSGAAPEIAAASTLRLRLTDSPALVPLETLPGRNHYRFTATEEPPWRWRVASIYPD